MKPSFPMDQSGVPIEGWVVLKLSVNSAGKAEVLEIVESSGSKVVELHAVKTIRFWDFAKYPNVTLTHRVAYDLQD